jgi:hypothetical protein
LSSAESLCLLGSFLVSSFAAANLAPKQKRKLMAGGLFRSKQKWKLGSVVPEENFCLATIFEFRNEPADK